MRRDSFVASDRAVWIVHLDSGDVLCSEVIDHTLFFKRAYVGYFN